MESKLLVCGLWRTTLHVQEIGQQVFSGGKNSEGLPSKAVSLHFGYGGVKRGRNVDWNGGFWTEP